MFGWFGFVLFKYILAALDVITEQPCLGHYRQVLGKILYIALL